MQSDTVADKLNRLRQQNAFRDEAQPSEASLWLQRFREAAAVQSSFDPGALLPAKGVGLSAEYLAKHRDEIVCELLKESVPSSGRDSKPLWTLQRSARREVLNALCQRGSGAIQSALLANPPSASKAAVETPDAVQSRMLAACLRSESINLNLLSYQELSALEQAIAWLDGIPNVKLPSLRRVQARLDWEELAKPLRALTGSHFRGRVAELDRLRNYVEFISPDSFVAKLTGILSRAATSVRAALGLREAPPLVIFGAGGIGKSTLLAKFILEHVAAAQIQTKAEKFGWVYLDLDRPELVAEEPVSLLLELIRQLEVQFESLEMTGAALRERWQALLTQREEEARQNKRAAPSRSDAAGSAALDVVLGDVAQDYAGEQVTMRSPLTAEDRSGMIAELGQALKEGRVGNSQPLLLVLDTFEEVQYRSRDYIASLFRFLDELQGQIPRLRTVISGRAAVRVSGYRTIDLELTRLDRDAAQGFLEAHGVSDPDIAQAIYKKFGGSPLTLRLAATVVTAEGMNPALESLDNINAKIEDNLVQGQLYGRILERIHNPEIRRLTFPGLVLRFITPEVIREVLAGPCEIEVADDAHARALFQEMQREAALITVEPDGRLRHLSYVRRAMLELLSKRQPEKVLQIHHNAVAYYARRSADLDGNNGQEIEDGAKAAGLTLLPYRAEEIYHRLCLGEDTASVDRRWINGIESYLRNAVSEVPPAAQNYLAVRTGVEITQEWEQSSAADWELYAERRARQFIAAQQWKQALDALRERSERLPGSPLFLLEAAALNALNMQAELQTVIYDGISLGYSSNEHKNLADMLAFEATLLVKSDNIQSAELALTQAQNVAAETADNSRFIDYGLRRLTLRRENAAVFQNGSAMTSGAGVRSGQEGEVVAELHRKLYHAYKDMAADSGAEQAQRIRRLGGELSLNYPNAVLHAMQVCVYDETFQFREEHRSALVSMLALWDALLCVRMNAEPGTALARPVGVDWSRSGDPLVDWREWSRRVPPSEQFKLLTPLARSQPVMAPILSVLAAILRGETARFWDDYHAEFAAWGGPLDVEADETRDKIKTGVQEGPHGSWLPIGGEIDLARKQIRILALAYDNIALALPAGDARTQIKEKLAVNMQMLAPVSTLFYDKLRKSKSPGERLAAIKALCAFPRHQALGWLCGSLSVETPFIGYHACIAIKEAAGTLPQEYAADIAAAVEDAMKRLALQPDNQGRLQVLSEARANLSPRPSARQK